MQEESQRKRRPKGSDSVINERKKLKTSGAEYKNYKGDVVAAKKEPSRDVLASLGPIITSGVLGAIMGYTAILIPQLLQEDSIMKIDEQQSSWVVSIAAVPMGPGCIIGGYSMEKIGRKATNIYACVILILGWFLIATSPNVHFILAGRFLLGLSDGIVSAPCVVYIAEISQPNLRGILIMSISVSLTFGVFFVHFVGTFLTWSLTAWICGIIPIPLVLVMCIMPESPFFLAKMQHFDEAVNVFYWFRGNSQENQTELEELIKRQKLLNSSPKVSFSQMIVGLTTLEFLKPAAIISLLFLTTQTTGHNVIAAYCVEIIRACGLDDQTMSEYTTMLIMDLFRLFASILACILVGKMKRRSLAFLGGYGITLILLLLCSYLYITPKLGPKSSFILLIMLVAYVFLISLSLLPLSWTMMGEMFPLAYRGLGTSITSCICFIFIYLILHTFPHLLKFFGGILGVFILYGILTLLGTIFLTLFLPETKDKQLYVIEDELK